MQQRQKLDELCNSMNNLFVAHDNLIGVSHKKVVTRSGKQKQHRA
jgi:hypothetical protein